MMIPTEPIGSIPRLPELVAALNASAVGGEQLERLHEGAVRSPALAAGVLEGCT